MGVASLVGGDSPSDFTQAAQWFSKAAEQGHAKAQRRLAMLYHNGEGVEVNNEQAFKWASKAGAQGDAEALTLLGTLYFAGEGTSANPGHAVELFTQAANAGDSLACEMLGAANLNGTGTPKDVLAALKWYTRAADHGRVNAQYVLGYLYSNGGEVAVNYPLANHWLLQAAIQGHAVAKINLVIHLDKGLGIARNTLKACALLRVALKQTLPNDIAAPMRVELEEEERTLSPQQLAEVVALESLYSTPAGLRGLQGALTSGQ